jgi:hypothetical protein
MSSRDGKRTDFLIPRNETDQKKGEESSTFHIFCSANAKNSFIRLYFKNMYTVTFSVATFPENLQRLKEEKALFQIRVTGLLSSAHHPEF